MKKILALLLVAIMVFALAACKPTETKDPTDTGSTPVETNNDTTPAESTEPEAVIAELRPLVNKEYGKDHRRGHRRPRDWFRLHRERRRAVYAGHGLPVHGYGL